MNRQQFLHEFSEVLGLSAADLTPSTKLSSLESWDSVAYLSTILLLDEKVGVEISPIALTSATTVQDILDAGGPALEN